LYVFARAAIEIALAARPKSRSVQPRLARFHRLFDRTAWWRAGFADLILAAASRWEKLNGLIKSDAGQQ
jgi:hypothetical protein